MSSTEGKPASEQNVKRGPNEESIGPRSLHTVPWPQMLELTGSPRRRYGVGMTGSSQAQLNS
jgi:hypothetical protein